MGRQPFQGSATFEAMALGAPNSHYYEIREPDELPRLLDDLARYAPSMFADIYKKSNSALG
jgi:hypothetical protein